MVHGRRIEAKDAKSGSTKHHASRLNFRIDGRRGMIETLDVGV
jgi:hypothetical protein